MQLSFVQRAEQGKVREQGVSDFAYTVAAARRSEQRRILSFVRMSDYMICDTLQVWRGGEEGGRGEGGDYMICNKLQGGRKAWPSEGGGGGKRNAEGTELNSLHDALLTHLLYRFLTDCTPRVGARGAIGDQERR